MTWSAKAGYTIKGLKKMNAVEQVNEGITALNGMSVAIERMKHQTAYFEQQLDRMDESENKSLYRRFTEWMTR